VLVRVPFLGTIGPDEGGYAYVAWQWAQGRQLYREVWIDRPQGLIVAYRLLVAIGQEAWTLRLGAVVAGAAVALLLVAAARVVSPAAGFLAGALFAVAGVAPHLEGFTFNGELAASVPATAAVAVALNASRRSHLRLAFAGALGGAALLMKQSGFDGLVVVLFVAWIGAHARRDRAERVLLVGAAAAIPVAASAIAGAASGWSSYWSAIVGSHLSAAGAARSSHFTASLPSAARDLLPLVPVAALGAWQARRRWGPSRFGVVWLAVGLVAVNVGGLYWAHYYVQLLPPLCLLGGIGLASLRKPALAWAAAALVSLPVAVFVGRLATASDHEQARLVKYALAFENDRRIAAYAAAHTSARETIYAFASRADVYFLARRRAAFPYLWGHPLRAARGRFGSLERTLSRPGRPKLVILFQRRPLRRHERLRRLIARYYRQVWTAPRTGTPVLAARVESR
jgi:hypothetical protein